ncbi:hypothetical protein BCR33DRAFT_737719 [Rhizoclosmatium globosum]|uniref:Uncharacterized protein n=1 Tax=Rhizoclosmatium globosum TaxID=329046 RepID=A0A1Y2CCB5_9FUNG|nr:hypothetical protein BCR33DRAFT_737719 [Rhizoclosmatium globosum]|eukprot:ORY44683.1 hypothetical protein BCR33DRAFT_737719 [Rhizoclosmatium globosum]
MDDDENVVVACETRKSPPEQNESEAEVDMEISDSESDGIVALEEGKPPLIEEVAVAGPELGVVGEIVIGPNGETDFEMDCDSVAGSDYDVLEVEAGPSMCLFTELPVIENPTVNTTICNEETKVAICCSSEECESDVESYTFGWEVKKALE